METIAKGKDLDDAESNIGSVINVVKALHGVETIQVPPPVDDGAVLIAAPAGMNVLDITSKIDARSDARREGPRRIMETEQAHTLESFCALVLRHKRAGTVVWAGDGPVLTAIIDYHPASDGVTGSLPAWKGHRVTYRFPFTESFSRWRQLSSGTQRDFLAFVQERARELVDPDDIDMPPPGTLARDVMLDVLRASGMPRAQREQVHPRDLYGSPAHLVDVAKRMSSKTGCTVKEVDRGLGGITVTFEDEKRVEGAENAREYYLIEVEVFRGSGRVIMPARLRAEATDHGLRLGLQLVGVDRVIEHAFTEALARVAKDTGCPVYQGAPA